MQAIHAHGIVVKKGLELVVLTVSETREIRKQVVEAFVEVGEILQRSRQFRCVGYFFC